MRGSVSRLISIFLSPYSLMAGIHREPLTGKREIAFGPAHGCLPHLFLQLRSTDVSHVEPGWLLQ